MNRITREVITISAAIAAIPAVGQSREGQGRLDASRESLVHTVPDSSEVNGSQRKTTGAVPVIAAGSASSVGGAQATVADRGNERAAVRPKPASLEEVIVTAQKREERLIDVPQSVSVLSSDVIARLGATQFRDFADTVPGLSFETQGAGFTRISLRGLTAGYGLSSTVGIYVDEVPYGSSSAFASGGRLALDMAPFDLSRIEVLRGPQGTLYGASAMGGLIKYVTNPPDPSQLEVGLQSGLSDTREGDVSYHGTMTLNAPIVTGKAAMRANAFLSHDGGYIDNLALGSRNVNQSDVYGGRADFLLTPTERINIRITGFTQNVSRDGKGTGDFNASGIPRDSSLDQRHATEEPFDHRFRLISGTAVFDLGVAKLTSVSSYQTVRAQTSEDVSAILVPALNGALRRGYSAISTSYDISTDKFAQEIRLGSDGAVRWNIGGFYTHEVSDRSIALDPRDSSGLRAANDLLSVSFPTVYEEIALFGDLTWRLSDKLDVTGGVRGSHNRQKFEQVGAGLLIRSYPVNRSDEDVLTYLANARYRLNEQSTLYLRYATGYRPGGPNFVVNNPATGLPIAPTTFDSDRLKSYEVGVKTESADRRLGVDLAAYYSDWENMIVSVVRGGFGVVGNAMGGASIRGAELTLTSHPTEAVTVSTSVAYQDAELANAEPDLRGRRGDELPFVPKISAAVSADYDLPWGASPPAVGATVRYVDERKADFGSAAYRLPDYAAVDFRVAFDVGATNFQFYLRNAFDERGQVSAVTLGTVQVAIMQPRTVGIQAATSF